MELFSLLPENCRMLAIVGVGCALLLQIIDRRWAARIIVGTVQLALIARILPPCSVLAWGGVIVLISIGISVGNRIVGAMFGRHTASHLFWALLIHDLILIPFQPGQLYRRR